MCESFASSFGVASSVCGGEVAEQVAAVGDCVDVVGGEGEW